MSLYNKMERKFGRYSISNLSLYLVVGYIIGYAIYLVNTDVYAMLMFDPYQILHGQVWRIVTWVLTLPESDNILFVAIMSYFYYSVGTTLERTWGTFRYNLYIFSGMFFTVVGGLILYVVLIMGYKSTGNIDILSQLGYVYDVSFMSAEGMQQAIGFIIGMSVSTYYINMSIFLAFAVTYPDVEVLMSFIIPVKVKWLGVLYAVFIIYEAIVSDWVGRVMIIASLLNFIIFFFTTRDYNRVSPKEIKRKREYRKKVYQAQQNATYANGARHKCAICGRTELDDANLTFRYCSKCTGGQEYCQEHLFTHEHR